MKVSHSFLTDGPDMETAMARVLRFLDKTILVQYDSVQVVQEDSLSAGQDVFWQKALEGVEQNRRILSQMIHELEEAGLEKLTDFTRFMEGYQSKTLHAAAHILDGFFGIDTAFYNLIADSHWITDALQEEIRSNPSGYWLVAVEGTFAATSGASLIHAEGEKAH